MPDLIIKTEKIEFTYRSHSEGSGNIKALSGIDLEIEKGQFVAIVGRNGSGKSTFARLLNALILPEKGTVFIKGLDTRDNKHLWEIRRSSGMVFQNPDNQIIGTIVEEDVAFGPENLGVEPAKIRERVDQSLETVGMLDYGKHSPHLLSGGQKQRIAIAGILAMRPECIILDEATAMLDPIGRKDIMSIMLKLNRDEKITVIHITHHMEEAIIADRVIVMDGGKAVMDGRPEEVFSKVEYVKGLGLDVPQVTELLYELNLEGLEMPVNALDVDGAFDTLVKALEREKI